jgi:membrane protease YdiL (CAAX protease family)
MPIFPAVLLLILALVIGLYLRGDIGEYARFKALTETRDRQKTYAKWVWQAFLLFGVASLIALAVMGRLETPLSLPPEFAGLRARLAPSLGHSFGDLGLGFLIGLVGAAIGGLFLGALLAHRRKKTGPVVVGDIEPLIPRNRPERLWGALLSLNAGFSEELFFRLLLPLLLAQLTGSAIAAFVIAAVVFGVIHLYQGWKGVLATGFIGVLMTVIYLATGQLWAAMLVHATIDLNGLLLQPWLAARKKSPA